MDNRNAVFTPEDLELLKRLSPELFASVQANERFADQAARGILANWKRRQSAAESEPEPAESPQLPAVQLPLWPEPLRAVPNSALRSALFGVIKRGRRRYLERERLVALEGIELWYTGPRLDQGDLDVWESILHTLREQNMGTECRTTSYHLLKLMGLSDTGKNRDTLQTRIARLRANAVAIKQGRYEYIGGLLDRAARDEDTQEWVIVLDPNMRALFAPDQFTMIQWSVRRALSGQPLAQWLHGFYSSHAAPYPLRIETLYSLSGSEAGELWKFTQTLKKALDAVARACAAAGEIFGWRIEDGLVFIKRTPSKSQRRHLARHGK